MGVRCEKEERGECLKRKKKNQKDNFNVKTFEQQLLHRYVYCDSMGSALTVPDYSTVASEVRASTWKAPASNHSHHNARKEEK